MPEGARSQEPGARRPLQISNLRFQISDRLHNACLRTRIPIFTNFINLSLNWIFLANTIRKADIVYRFSMDAIFIEQSSSGIPTVKPKSLLSFLTPSISTILLGIAVVCYIIYRGARPFLQRYYLLPPTEYRTIIKDAASSSNGAIPSSKVGVKSASVRRRLIMGAAKPQVYSTLPLNSITKDEQEVDNTEAKYRKLKVAAIDRVEKADRDRFLMNIKPIEVRSYNRKKIYGFFHPFSYALGGGEKVLWEAVMSTLENEVNNIVVIYTFTPNKNTSVYSILEGVRDTFGIDFLRPDRSYLRDRIVFIHLPDKYQWLIVGSSYKFLSMIFQALGSVILTVMAFQQLTPDVFIDTIGVPFTYSFVYGFLDIPISSYIHYPAVSRDMLKAATNIGGLYGFIKYWYWWSLLKLYAFNILWVDLTLYNSTWTAENVLSSLGWLGGQIDMEDRILYPPCVNYDDTNFDAVSPEALVSNEREKSIVYLAQFRPEKRHFLLVKHYKEYLTQLKKTDIKTPHRLIFIGSVRSGKDEEYIGTLADLIEELEIPKELIQFKLNASTEFVNKTLQTSDFGINCMWKEHFGIAIVEYMLNGAIPLVHASAGPLEDIVIPRVDGHVLSRKERMDMVKISESANSGFFFKDETDPDFSAQASVERYPTLTETLLKASALSDTLKKQMRENAIAVAREKFGRGAFSKVWTKHIFQISEVENKRREARGRVESAY
jgi:alpha-1,2-mannosyltransferase